MSRISAVTGSSVHKTGKTELQFGMVKPDGTFIARELQHHFRDTIDITKQTFNSSSMGSNAGVLGMWNKRDIDVPDGSIMFLNWIIKSASMPLLKQLTFAFEVSDSNPFVELLFPVITDRHSTLHELPLQARLRILGMEEIEKQELTSSGDMAIIQKRAYDCMDNLSSDGVVNYWNTLVTRDNDEGRPFIAISGNGPHEDYAIKVKYMLGGLKALKPKAIKEAKTVKTTTGRHVRIASRKRRLRVQ